jgi:hypothetical protein
VYDCIIPKTEFRVAKRLKTLMNFYNCCKNGQTKAPNGGAQRGERTHPVARYNQRFSSATIP